MVFDQGVVGGTIGDYNVYPLIELNVNVDGKKSKTSNKSQEGRLLKYILEA